MRLSLLLTLLSCSLPVMAQDLHSQLFHLDSELLAAESEFSGSSHPAGLELLEGLFLPGFNQAVHGEWWKTAVFVAVEAGALAISSKLSNEGHDLEREFQEYARENWSYETFITNRVDRHEYALEEAYMNPGEDGINGTGDEAEDGTGLGSHVLPGHYELGWDIGDYQSWNHFTVTETQQFFEMIGKYAQFQRGWSDFDSEWSVTYFTPNSSRYMDMRTEANDKLIAADNWLGLLVVNHVVSFMDVVIRRARNNRHEQRADTWYDLDRWQVSTRQLPMEVAPVTTVQLSWSFRGL